MRSPNGRYAGRGQALVELLVAVPLLALLAATALGMFRFAMAAPWLDERLEARLLCPEDPACEGLAASLRREIPFPAYPSEDEVRFSRTDPGRRMRLGPLHRTLDGGMAVQEAVLKAGPDPSMRRMPSPGPAFAGTAVRRLGWWRCSRPRERDVRGRVEKVLLAGLPGKGMIQWIRTAGMEPIRVDLDVLPASARRNEGPDPGHGR